MPTVVTETLSSPESPQPPRKRWTRAECALLGWLESPDLRHIELIEGELINRMGKKPPHTNVLMAVMIWLQDAFGREYVVPERPIDVAPQDVPTSEPEPDLIVLTRPWREFYVNPGPGDLRLAVEVSDSTVNFDRSTKAALYARAGIAEYWVADIPRRRLIVHRDPQGGQYRTITAYNEGESVNPLAAPDRQFQVAEAFSGVPKS
ncbi:MAG TPA: Uma2 family endonuclease [Bryobacteraceae bacterium]|nr:Uma2 family endonuclease [Bryobacteraceae bacterium]